MLEVEPDEVYAGRPEVVREEHRWVAVRESYEVSQTSRGTRLRRRDGPTREERAPLPHGRSIVSVAVHDRDRARIVRLHLILNDAVQVRHHDRRAKASPEDDGRRLVRGHEDPAGAVDLRREVRSVAGYRDLLTLEEGLEFVIA